MLQKYQSSKLELLNVGPCDSRFYGRAFYIYNAEPKAVEKVNKKWGTEFKAWLYIYI